MELRSGYDALPPAVSSQGRQVKTSGQEETRLGPAQAGERRGKGGFAATGGASEEEPVARLDAEAIALQDRCTTLAVVEDECVRLQERGLVPAFAHGWGERQSRGNCTARLRMRRSSDQ